MKVGACLTKFPQAKHHKAPETPSNASPGPEKRTGERFQSCCSMPSECRWRDTTDGKQPPQPFTTPPLHDGRQPANLYTRATAREDSTPDTLQPHQNTVKSPTTSNSPPRSPPRQPISQQCLPHEGRHQAGHRLRVHLDPDQAPTAPPAPPVFFDRFFSFLLIFVHVRDSERG